MIKRPLLDSLSPSEKARKIRAEKLKRAKYDLYRADPMEWLKDVMGEDLKDYKWSEHDGYGTHQWDGDRDPLWKLFMYVSRRVNVCLKSSTGTGKTYALSRLVLWFLDCFPNSYVVTSAPNEGQLKRNLWSEISRVMDKFSAVRPYTRLTKLNLKPDGNNTNPKCTTRYSHEAVGITVMSGQEEETTPRIAGIHREHLLIILEETPGISAAILNTFFNTCTGSNNIMVAVGNPDSETDTLHMFSKFPEVKTLRVSSYDHPNVLLNEEIYLGAITSKSINLRRLQYGEDSPLYLSRVRGITPSDSENSLVKRSWIDQCTEGHLTFNAKEKPGFPAVGVDVANSEDGDKAALGWGRGNVLDSLHEFKCPNASHLAHNMYLPNDVLVSKGFNVYHTDKVYDRNIMGGHIGIDTVGIGVSTLNTFLENGYNPTSLAGPQWDEVIPRDNEGKLMYKFANLRSQMYWEFREDLRLSEVVISITDTHIYNALVKELTVIRFALSANSIAIEPKELIKKRLEGKSPNLADCAVYWNWTRKGYRFDVFPSLPMKGGK